MIEKTIYGKNYLETPQNVPNLLVLSRRQAEQFQSKESHICISIWSSEESSSPPVLPDCSSRMSSLLLDFYDYSIGDFQNYSIEKLKIERTGKLPPLFNDDKALEIYEFVMEHTDKVELIVVHCEGGASRSAGVALALAHGLYSQDYRASWGGYNDFVYEKLMEVIQQATPSVGLDREEFS